MKKPIESVLVVGYGTMGKGIVLSFARAGFDTTVLSRDPSRIVDLPKGARAVAELPTAAPDLIIESVPERLELKAALFERLERAYGDASILASNTSGLPLDRMAAPLAHPENFIGIHYMHPAEALPLVEVIRVPQTTDDTFARCIAALKRTGKDAIVLNRPVEGFLFNRLQHAILHEAYYLIEQGIVTHEDVDKAAKWLLGPRCCVTGLIEQKDISGLDTHAIAQRNLVPVLCHSTSPSRIVQDKEAAGEFGVKTGTGFYDWRNRDVAAHRRKAEKKLQRILAILQE